MTLPYRDNVGALLEGYDIIAGSTRAFVAPAGLPGDVRGRLAGALERAIVERARAR